MVLHGTGQTVLDSYGKTVLGNTGEIFMSKAMTFEGALDRLHSIGLPDLRKWKDGCAGRAIAGNTDAAKHWKTLNQYMSGDIRDEEAIIKLAEVLALEMPRE